MPAPKGGGWYSPIALHVETDSVDAWFHGDEPLATPANLGVNRFFLDCRAQPLVKPRRQLFAIETQMNCRRTSPSGDHVLTHEPRKLGRRQRPESARAGDLHGVRHRPEEQITCWLEIDSPCR